MSSSPRALLRRGFAREARAEERDLYFLLLLSLSLSLSPRFPSFPRNIASWQFSQQLCQWSCSVLRAAHCIAPHLLPSCIVEKPESILYFFSPISHPFCLISTPRSAASPLKARRRRKGVAENEDDRSTVPARAAPSPQRRKDASCWMKGE